MFTRDPLFWKVIGNTLYMVIGIPLGMALSLAIALLLNLEVRGVAVWRTFFYLPSIVPAVASSILWIWIFNPRIGLLNNVLAAFGIHGPNWLQDEHTSKIALILMGLWSAGGGMIVWLAGLKGISPSYYEAAALDGANAWQRFRTITLPLLTPYIFFNLIMGLIATLQIFTQSFIMTQGGPIDSTLFYAYHLFNNAFRFLQMGYASALGWFLFLAVFLLTLLQLKLSKRWVHYEEWMVATYDASPSHLRSVIRRIALVRLALYLDGSGLRLNSSAKFSPIDQVFYPSGQFPEANPLYLDDRMFANADGPHRDEAIAIMEEQLRGPCLAAAGRSRNCAPTGGARNL